MALVWKDIARAENGKAFIRVLYETTGQNVISRVEWQNDTAAPRRVELIRTDTDQVVFSTMLAPGPEVGFIDIPSARFRLDQYRATI